jgi:hydrogenase-4 component E
MTDHSAGAALLALTSGTILLCAALALWRRAARGIVSALRVQGFALAATAAVLGVQLHEPLLLVTAGLLVAVKGVVIPMLFGRLVRLDPASSETDPVVNVPASLVAAVVLTLVAFVATRPIVESVRGVPITLVPFGFATVLIGFFVLVARRKAVSQMVGLLLVDNGIGLVALLLTTGVPLLIELGGTLDVLLVVVVLRVLVTRMHAQLGVLDLDSLQELRD